MLSGLCGDPPRSLGTFSVLLTWPMSVSMGCLWFPPPLLIHMEKPLPCYNDSTLPTESRHYMAQYSNSSQCFPSLHSFPLCSHSAHIPKMAPAPNILYFSHTMSLHRLFLPFYFSWQPLSIFYVYGRESSSSCFTVSSQRGGKCPHHSGRHLSDGTAPSLIIPDFLKTRRGCGS